MTIQKVTFSIPCVCDYLRHEDDTEVQPVPGVPQKGEGPHTKAPGQDLYQGLKGVYTCKGVPRGSQGKGEERAGGHQESRKFEILH